MKCQTLGGYLTWLTMLVPLSLFCLAAAIYSRGDLDVIAEKVRADNGSRRHLAKPLHRHLIFYRHDETTLDLVRIMHGARDLSRRLPQPPGAEEDDLETQ